MRASIVILFLVLVFAQTDFAFAQGLQATDSGVQEFNRQQERERLLRQQQEQVPHVKLTTPVDRSSLELLPEAEVPCFQIRKLILAGELATSFQWLLHAADSTSDGRVDVATGRCLGSAAINLVMKRMQNALVSQGYVTSRVLAGPQELAAGVLTLTLLLGRVRDVRFADGTSGRATQWNAVSVRPGDVLNLKDIEQALENFKRVPTVEADIQIVPAEKGNARPGESDIVIRWQQAFPLRLNLSIDNSGTAATGNYLGALTLSYDHALTLNDLFYLSVNHDLGGGEEGNRGTEGQTIHYALPFGYWLLGLTASHNRYRQSASLVNQSILYSGESWNQELKFSRLVVRNAARKTTLSFSIWTRSSNNFINDTEVQVQRRQMAGWEMGVASREYLGRSTLDINAAYRRGTGAFGALAAPEEASGEGTSRPQIISLGAQLNTPFSIAAQHLRYSATARGQWNDTPLIAQDRFAIGSRYTVRGFENGRVLLGERGWFLRNDLGLSLAQSGQELYLGLDYGEVSGQSSAALAGRHLSGMAIGLRGSLNNYAYEVFLSRALSAPRGFDAGGTNLCFSLNAGF
jgi:hemolysin activation/secretion protein